MSTAENMPPSRRCQFFYGWYVVAACWIMLFIAPATSVGIFFEPMLEEFGWDRATLASAQTVALLVYAATSPFLGRFIDRFGPRTMLLVNSATQTLGSVTSGLATSIWHLYISRYLYEIKVLHPAQVLINRWFVKYRGKAQGITASGVPIGTLLLSPVSEYLVLIWTWRATILFWAGVTFIFLLPLTLMIRNNPADKGHGPNGEPLYSNIPYSPANPENSTPSLRLTSTSNSLSAVIRKGSFWLLSSTQLICGLGCGFIMTHIVIFTTDFGYSDMIGASLLSVYGGANLLGVLLTGHMSDRITKSRVLALTHFIRGLSFFVVVIFILLGGGSLWLLYAAMALFGFGWFTTAPLAAGVVADLFGEVRMGTIIGVTLSSHTIGCALGAYIGGVTFDTTGSYFLYFPIQGILEMLAAGFALAMKQSVKHKEI